MKKLILPIFAMILLFLSCAEERKKFVPNPKYDTGEMIYMKPDSTLAYIKFFSVLVGKDTTYFYGVEYKYNIGKYHRRVLGDKEIFGAQTKKED
jgi:hypothetical protein